MVSEGRKSLIVLHRSRFDVMASVLSVAVSGMTKTYIRRKCNLNYRQLEAHIELLVNQDLLEVESHEGKSNSVKIFLTTEKGQAFLRAYRDLKDTIKEGANRFL